MKTWKIAALVVAVVAIAGTLLTASAFAMMNGYGYYTGANNAGYGNMMNGNYPSSHDTMMSGYNYSPNSATDCGNHGQINSATTGSNPISINQSLTNAQNYLTTLNNPDLTVKQVEEHTSNFYVQVIEKSTGNGAFELVVDKYTGAVYPEMGPNMMWNTKYTTPTNGMMNGMMGSNGMMSGLTTVTPTTNLPVTQDQAKADAQQYLNQNYAGTTTGDVTTFYGYYTFEVNNNGNGFGMVSVNGYTGQVWYHTWHGSFVQELDMS